MNDEPLSSRKVGVGFLAFTCICVVAGAATAIGALLGILVGANDGIPYSKSVFGIVGMLLSTFATLAVVPRVWRRRYLAILPMLYIMVAGSLLQRSIFGEPSSFSSSLIAVIAIVVGQMAGQVILNQPVEGEAVTSP